MTDDNQSGDKLYAGKFKTVEELEAGYKSSAVVFDENSNLKKKVEELTSIPDAYQNPSDLEVDQNRVSDIQARAKEAGMTQVQYEKFLRGDKARVESHKQSFEQAKKDLGEANINILQDYVNKHYPKELSDSMMKTFIGNKTARDAALAHRDQLLNNTMPGMGKVSAGGSYHISDADIKKAYDAKERSKSVADINRYLNLVAQKANQQAG